jgi:hypothetical protein
MARKRRVYNGKNELGELLGKILTQRRQDAKKRAGGVAGDWAYVDIVDIALYGYYCIAYRGVVSMQ